MSHKRTLVALLVCALAPTVGPLAAQVPDAVRLKEEAFRQIDTQADRLGRIADAIFSYSELGFYELNTAKLLTETLEREGFRVERGVAGMPTAYRASYGSGAPVIGLMADFDAIPGASQRPGVVGHDPLVEGAPGHGEGHNTNPLTVLGAAVAVKDLIDRYGVTGTVVVYGGPAEEVVASRGYMVNAGLFEGVDAVMDAHISTGFGTSYGLSNSAIVSVQWTFEGVQGHAASPWTGKSALDGVELMNTGMNFLREHLPLDMRFHYVITDGGEQPNVIPAKATVWYYLRQRNYESLVDLLEKARGVAAGAAEMTGTTVSERILSGSWPINGNRVLAELLQRNVEHVGMPDWSADDIAFAESFQRAMGNERIRGLPTEVGPISQSRQGSSSSDAGDVTWNVPYARLRFPSQAAGAISNHHWSAAIAVATPMAHKGIVVGAKAIAGTMIDLFTDPSHIRTIKDDFARQMAGVTWTSLIPLGAEPPTFLNEEKMARWRPLLEQYYYDPDSPQTLLEEWGIEYPPRSGAVPNRPGR